MNALILSVRYDYFEISKFLIECPKCDLNIIVRGRFGDEPIINFLVSSESKCTREGEILKLLLNRKDIILNYKNDYMIEYLLFCYGQKSEEFLTVVGDEKYKI